MVAKALLLKTSLITNSSYLSALKTFPHFPSVEYQLQNEYQGFM